MPTSSGGAELFIVDNSDSEWKVRQYLQEWSDIAGAFDVATGYFEIGALLALDGKWQQLDKLRILMGDEVSKRTKRTLVEGVERASEILDRSIEREKEANDFLDGVPAIVNGLGSGQIECRVYNKAKFHAKAYITHGKSRVVGSSALVGSSNFTVPGLTENVELNIQLRREVEVLQEWFERYWDKAESITPQILKVIQRHTREYSPFVVYAKALQEYLRDHELSASEWDRTRSQVYRHLDRYQKEGYQALIRIASEYNGAFLCDGVGLGKTYIGLMVIERLVVQEGKNVVLLVTKQANKPVWDRAIKKYLRHLSGDFNHLVVYNHSDLTRGGEFPGKLAALAERADAFVIDEAHHFRNKGVANPQPGRQKSRYRQLFDMLEGKKVFMLTATPINNSLLDLLHLIQLFSRDDRAYFSRPPLSIHSLDGHFRKLDRDLDQAARAQDAGHTDVETNVDQALQVLGGDELFREIVVQRSRAYVRKSQSQYGESAAMFPNRDAPRVVNYSVKKTYGRLLEAVERAFEKDRPLFTLAVYYPLNYRREDHQSDAWEENRQKALVGLIRTGFLKRFESSTAAFEASCRKLFQKLLSWVDAHATEEHPHEMARLDKWKRRNEDIVRYVTLKAAEDAGIDVDLEDEDAAADVLLDDVEPLSWDSHKIEDILDDTYEDLQQIIDFLKELRRFTPIHDDKLQALIRLLKRDKDVANCKVLIFTEFMTTARYLCEQLSAAGIDAVDEVDSADRRDRGEVIAAFSPYYNDSSSGELKARGRRETNILISTDVLSEGLNLQDAARIINYDLHWNPVRLMQRIGRVDRRMDPGVETQLVADHPEQAGIRGRVLFWNFLPPVELDNLLRLYKKVSHKTLRISKVFGIEGKKLLTPEDDFDALKDFTHAMDEEITPIEGLRLEFQQLLDENPGLAEELKNLPGRVFTGKQHPKPASQAVFFCYLLPAPEPGGDGTADSWTTDAGRAAWYLYDLGTEQIIAEPSEIVDIIRSSKDTPYRSELPKPTLKQIREEIEKHIKNTYLKRADAPVGIKPKLVCWMELNKG